MIVYIDKQVYQVLDEFYEASMRKHITLDYQTVLAKIDRLEQAMYDFASVAGKVHHPPYRRDWQAAGYWELYILSNYHDAVHDALNYNIDDI